MAATDRSPMLPKAKMTDAEMAAARQDLSRIDALRESLGLRGIKAFSDRRLRLTVSYDRRKSPDRTSFWVASVGSTWYIGTWGSQIAVLLDRKPVEEVCATIMGLSADQVLCRISPEVLAENGLRELLDAEFESFYRQKFVEEAAFPPETTPDELSTQLGVIARNTRPLRPNSWWIQGVSEAGAALNELWIALYANHWYVRTPQGQVFSCDDTIIVNLCYEALRHATLLHEGSLCREFLDGYGMREVGSPDLDEISRTVGWSAGTPSQP